MKKHITLLSAVAIATLFSSQSSYAQGVAINTTGSVADGSAMLDVASTTQGMLVPRMDSAQRSIISSPATGLLVYQTDGVAPGFYFYNGSAWVSLSSGLSNVTTQGNTFNGANQLVQLNGSGALPAVSGSALTSLNASNISSGTVATARLGTGITDTSHYLRGDGTWAIPPSGSGGSSSGSSLGYVRYIGDTSAVTIRTFDGLVWGTDGSAAFTLPAASSVPAGHQVIITTYTPGATGIDIKGNGTDTIYDVYPGSSFTTGGSVTANPTMFGCIAISNGSNAWILYDTN